MVRGESAVQRWCRMNRRKLYSQWHDKTFAPTSTWALSPPESAHTQQSYRERPDHWEFALAGVTFFFFFDDNSFLFFLPFIFSLTRAYVTFWTHSHIVHTKRENPWQILYVVYAISSGVANIFPRQRFARAHRAHSFCLDGDARQDDTIFQYCVPRRRHPCRGRGREPDPAAWCLSSVFGPRREYFARRLYPIYYSPNPCAKLFFFFLSFSSLAGGSRAKRLIEYYIHDVVVPMQYTCSIPQHLRTNPARARIAIKTRGFIVVHLSLEKSICIKQK